MSKVLVVAKGFVGVVLTVFVAASLHFFESWIELGLGAGLMLSGVCCAYFLKKQSRGIVLTLIFASGCVPAVFVLGLMSPLPWHFVQYFLGGGLVYLGCRMVVREQGVEIRS